MISAILYAKPVEFLKDPEQVPVTHQCVLTVTHRVKVGNEWTNEIVALYLTEQQRNYLNGKDKMTFNYHFVLQRVGSVTQALYNADKRIAWCGMVRYVE